MTLQFENQNAGSNRDPRCDLLMRAEHAARFCRLRGDGRRHDGADAGAVRTGTTPAAGAPETHSSREIDGMRRGQSSGLQRPDNQIQQIELLALMRTTDLSVNRNEAVRSATCPKGHGPVSTLN